MTIEALIFAFLLLIYFVISGMIMYHLQTYTINNHLARVATMLFVLVTIVMIVVQGALVLGLLYDTQTQQEKQEMPFGIPQKQYYDTSF